MKFNYKIRKDKTYSLNINGQDHKIAGHTIYELVEDFLLLYKNGNTVTDGFTCKDCKFVFTKQFIESQTNFDEWHVQLHRRVMK